MNLQDIFSAIRKKALFCSLLSCAFSFIAGFSIGYIWGFSALASFVISLCFSITALPIVIRFMNHFQITDTKIGHTAMGSAVILDVIALLLLGIILNIESINSTLEFLKIISTKAVGMVLFFIVVMVVNQFLRSEISKVSRAKNAINKLIRYLDEEAIFGVGVVFVLLFSTVTEALGFHFIIGAFFGGLLLNKDILGISAFKSMSKTLNAITDQFLTPIFFAFIGLQLSINAFDHPIILLSIISVAYVSKIFGSWLGARWAWV